MSKPLYEIRITRTAEKDIQKLPLKVKSKLHGILTEVIAKDPFQGKKLMGDLLGSYSYRLTYQDRIVYSLNTQRRVVFLERARTHYGD